MAITNLTDASIRKTPVPALLYFMGGAMVGAMVRYLGALD